jgi:hypothetical protein
MLPALVAFGSGAMFASNTVGLRPPWRARCGLAAGGDSCSADDACSARRNKHALRATMARELRAHKVPVCRRHGVGDSEFSLFPNPHIYMSSYTDSPRFTKDQRRGGAQHRHRVTKTEVVLHDGRRSWQAIVQAQRPTWGSFGRSPSPPLHFHSGLPTSSRSSSMTWIWSGYHSTRRLIPGQHGSCRSTGPLVGARRARIVRIQRPIWNPSGQRAHVSSARMSLFLCVLHRGMLS